MERVKVYTQNCPFNLLTNLYCRQMNLFYLGAYLFNYSFKETG